MKISGLLTVLLALLVAFGGYVAGTLQTSSAVLDTLPDTVSVPETTDMVEFLVIVKVPSNSQIVDWKETLVPVSLIGAPPMKYESLVVTQCPEEGRVYYCSTSIQR